MISSRFGRTKPHGCVPAGEYVLFHAERRNVKTMNYVLRSHDQLNVAPNGHMQLIDLADALHVLQLPHPLFCNYINLAGVLRRSAHLEEKNCTPNKDDDKNAERNNGPADFQYQRSLNRSSFAPMTA